MQRRCQGSNKNQIFKYYSVFFFTILLALLFSASMAGGSRIHANMFYMYLSGTYNFERSLLTQNTFFS